MKLDFRSSCQVQSKIPEMKSCECVWSHDHLVRVLMLGQTRESWDQLWFAAPTLWAIRRPTLKIK